MTQKPSPRNEREAALILVEALVKLSKAKVPYNFFISKMLWGASQVLEYESFAMNWKTYKRASIAAQKIQIGNRHGWRKDLTLEHCLPLNVMYRKLLYEGDQLTIEKPVEIIGEYPPVLVTREENANMPKEFRNAGAPNERYARIPCDFKLETRPKLNLK